MMHQKSSFITLTYSDENLPGHANRLKTNLYKKDLQDFWKRLRKRLYDREIRYYAVGEYGKTVGPHYHAATFGVDFNDKEIVSEVWGFGRTQTAFLNKDTAAYITSYIIKGWQDNNKKQCILGLQGREKEFMVCSRRPGIGGNFIDKMAKKLNTKSYMTPKRAISEMKIGKRNLPVGKYLQKRLMHGMVGKNDYLKIGETILDERNYERQNELFDDHLEKEISYYESIVKEKENERFIQEKRRKIYGAKRQL